MPLLALIVWPYHAGLADVGVGLGASVLAADERLLSMLHDEVDEVLVERVAPVDESLPEIARIFELDRRLARHVAEARDRAAFPLVLAGNCVSCLGTTARARDDGRDFGVVWLDARPRGLPGRAAFHLARRTGWQVDLDPDLLTFKRGPTGCRAPRRRPHS